MNPARNSFITSALCAIARHQMLAAAASYDVWTVSSVNRIGDGISTGIGQIVTVMPSSASAAIVSA